MQQVNLIVNCTNRKKAVVPEELRLRSLGSEPLSRRLEQWLHRLTTHGVPSRRATDLYAGDHWQVARSIPREGAEGYLDVRLWICSAGYGLIRESDMLKPYSATFTPGYPDSVTTSSSGATNGIVAGEWWSGLCAHRATREAPRTITELAAHERRVPMVLVASQPYILAMISDVLEAIDALASQDLFSILSIGARSKRLTRLEARLLPADARFEAVVGGTRAALNVRIARFLFRRLASGTVPSTALLASVLARLSAELPPLRAFDRRRLSDKQVRRFIDKEKQADPSVSKTRLLKRLRASGAACEQARFSEIFKQAVEVSGNA